MRKSEPTAKVTSNTTVVALAALIVLLGAGFLFAYDSLRSHRAQIASVALQSGKAATKDGERPKYRGEDDYDALIDLGIDPNDASLSPAARKVIDRAHRAAMEAGAARTGSEVPGDTSGETSGAESDTALDAEMPPAAPGQPGDMPPAGPAGE